MRVAVIGAGPAGLICAWQLAKQGHELSLFEKKSTFGAQGAGVIIQPVGLQALESLEILQEVEALGQRINHLRGYAGFKQRRQVIAADYSLLTGHFNYSLGINRSALWSILFKKVQASNVTLEIDVHIVNLSYQVIDGSDKIDDIMVIDDSNQERGCFDLVIDASGANSILRRYANTNGDVQVLQYGSMYAKLELPEDSVYNTDALTIYTGDNNQGVGLMPTGRLQRGHCKTISMFFNIDWQRFSESNNQGANEKWSQESFDAWKQSIIERLPTIEHLMKQLTHVDQLYSAKFKHCTLAQPFGERIVFVGDAAHCSSPQLGQGINMSLIDSLILTQALQKPNDINAAIKSYAKARARQVWFYQTLAKFITPIYQSDNSIAILARDHFFGFFIKLFVFKWLSTIILSGRIGRPFKGLRRL